MITCTPQRWAAALLLAFALALAAPAGLAQAQQSNPAPESAVTVTDTHVREGPSTQTAIVGHLGPEQRFEVLEMVGGEEVLAGNVTWFRTPDGFVYSGFTRPQGGPPLEVSSPQRFITVDRSLQVVRAFEGDTLVFEAPATVGVPAFPTPVGTFRILRRVLNETMDSRTIGIPLSSPNGYFLTDVLFTQYFTADGVAFHYNYWSPRGAFGNYPASHGCVGLQFEDAQFLWNFADIGTAVIVVR